MARNVGIPVAERPALYYFTLLRIRFGLEPVDQ